MAQESPPLAQDLQGLIGPLIIGTAISTFLFGVSLAQVYTYFSIFKTDRPIYRFTVVGLFILDILHTVFCQITLWKWFVTSHEDLTIFMVAPWSFAVSPVICGTAAFFVQIFYAHRVYFLSNRNSVIPALIVFGALFQFVWAAATTGKVFIIKYFTSFRGWTYGVSCWLCGAAITDLLITASLIWILLNSKHGIRRTNNIIDQLVALTIETNGLTFTVAVLDLILFTSVNDASHVGPHLCLVKLYINSYLFSLNCRKKIAEEFDGSKTIHTSAILNELQSSTLNEPQSNDEFTFHCHLPPSNVGYGLDQREKRRANHESSGGIRVFTTATLSTERSNNNAPSARHASNLRHMRLDSLNTFTTSIVGGVEIKEDLLRYERGK